MITRTQIESTRFNLAAIPDAELIKLGDNSGALVVAQTDSGPVIYGARQKATPGNFEVTGLPDTGIVLRLGDGTLRFAGDELEGVQMPLSFSTSLIGSMDEEARIALETAVMNRVLLAMKNTKKTNLKWSFAGGPIGSARLVALESDGEGGYVHTKLAAKYGLESTFGYVGAQTEDGAKINVLYAKDAQGPIIITIDPVAGEEQITRIEVTGKLEFGGMDVSPKTLTAAFCVQVDSEWKTYLKLRGEDAIQETKVIGATTPKFDSDGHLTAIGQDGTTVAYYTTEIGAIDDTRTVTVIEPAEFTGFGEVTFDVRTLLANTVPGGANLLFIGNTDDPAHFAVIEASKPTFTDKGASDAAGQPAVGV